MSDVVLPGGDVYFALTWSVVLVVVVVIYTGTAVFCSHFLWWVVLVTRFLYC